MIEGWKEWKLVTSSDLEDCETLGIEVKNGNTSEKHCERARRTAQGLQRTVAR